MIKNIWDRKILVLSLFFFVSSCSTNQQDKTSQQDNTSYEWIKKNLNNKSFVTNVETGNQKKIKECYNALRTYENLHKTNHGFSYDVWQWSIYSDKKDGDCPQIAKNLKNPDFKYGEEKPKKTLMKRDFVPYKKNPDPKIPFKEPNQAQDQDDNQPDFVGVTYRLDGEALRSNGFFSAAHVIHAWYTNNDKSHSRTTSFTEQLIPIMYYIPPNSEEKKEQKIKYSTSFFAHEEQANGSTSITWKFDSYKVLTEKLVCVEGTENNCLKVEERKNCLHNFLAGNILLAGNKKCNGNFVDESSSGRYNFNSIPEQ